LIRNIIFGGCSLTWGQSLHYESGYKDVVINQNGFFDSDSLKHRHYQYMIDNRFATKVADYFGRKSIVRAMNGGDNCIIANLVNKKVNDFTDAIIIQTTSFSRCNKSIEQQFDGFLDIIKKYEHKGILVRFIHLDIPIELIPNEILERTIYFGQSHSFYNLLMDKNSKYSIEYTFKVPDNHFNQDGHNLVSSTLIENLISLLKKPIYK